MDELAKIEDRKAWQDMGKMGAMIYKGAFEEGGDITVAMLVTQAFYFGMFKGSREEESDSSD